MTSSHASRVDAWLERASERRSPKQLIKAFDIAFGALWRRSHQTLGEVTITAILDRVVHTAAERHPELAGLEVTPRGLSCARLLRNWRPSTAPALKKGIRFVLVEYLSVLSNLTADILTPSLHEELAKLEPAKATRRSPARGEPGKRRARTRKLGHDHDE